MIVSPLTITVLSHTRIRFHACTGTQSRSVLVSPLCPDSLLLSVFTQLSGHKATSQGLGHLCSFTQGLGHLCSLILFTQGLGHLCSAPQRVPSVRGLAARALGLTGIHTDGDARTDSRSARAAGAAEAGRADSAPLWVTSLRALTPSQAHPCRSAQ